MLTITAAKYTLQVPSKFNSLCFSLETPVIDFTGNLCLSFFYDMNGAGMGRLNVYADDGTVGRRLVWTHVGPEAERWAEARVAVDVSANTTVSDIW